MVAPEIDPVTAMGSNSCDRDGTHRYGILHTGCHRMVRAYSNDAGWWSRRYVLRSIERPRSSLGVHRASQRPASVGEPTREFESDPALAHGSVLRYTGYIRNPRRLSQYHGMASQRV